MPDSIHAVSVSLPTIRDLIAYEEQDPRALQTIHSGYPRFHTHPYVALLREHIRSAHGLGSGPLLLVTSERAARDLCAHCRIVPPAVYPVEGGLFAILLSSDPAVEKKARAFQQHAGCIVSSRRAESFLLEAGVLDFAWPEAHEPGVGDRHVREALASAYGTANEDVHLSVTGMNAIHGLYRCVNEVLLPWKRSRWVRHGWVFMDSMKILDTFCGDGVNRTVSRVHDLESLEKVLAEYGHEVGAIFTEVPSNPLVQTPDVQRLRELADRYGYALVIDATLGTPHNVDVLPYADACVESLTKYANGGADVMMGAVILNRHSRWYGDLAARLPAFLDAPYEGDLRRLAFNITGYGERMRRVNQNTQALVEFFEGHESVSNVYWAYAANSRQCYEAIQRVPESPGGLITLELSVPLAQVYDRLELAKGPSLGAEFTLVGPYLYHAHYDLVSTPQGRRHLASCGLSPDLLRVSVGVEPIDELMEAFAAAL